VQRGGYVEGINHLSNRPWVRLAVEGTHPVDAVEQNAVEQNAVEQNALKQNTAI
jgi:hypothetical protein